LEKICYDSNIKIGNPISTM